jgi:exopolysaccharide biosynthesis polyprenyl glycosylphosphotransferase
MKKLFLLLSDTATLYGTLVLVLLLRYGPDRWQSHYQSHVVPFSILFLVWLFALYIANLYEERALRNGRDFYERLLQAVAIAAGLSVAFFYLIPYFGITPKINLFLFIIIFSILETSARYAFNRTLAGGNKKQLLIVGSDEDSLELARFVTDNPQFGYGVKALVLLGQRELDMGGATGPWMMLDERTDLVAFIGEQQIDVVVISPQAYRSADLIGMLYSARGQQVDFALLGPFAERLTGTVPLGAISQQWFLENVAENSQRPYETAKRAVDVVAAIALGIPVLVLSPLIILAIWLDSPGYPLIHQRRTGLHGTPFTLIKFRSMIPEAEKHSGAVWASEHDPRVTRIGRFLRKTRLDELPQLWNVLRGDLSLVGPRAERPEFDAKLAVQVPFYLERYFIKPGLSGWAQINYPYGASVQDAIEKLQYDLYYIKHRSLVLDLEIILKTINIALRREGK